MESLKQGAKSIIKTMPDTLEDLQPVTDQIDPEKVEPYKVYNNNIDLYTDQFIESEYPEKSIDDLKQDRAFFPRLIQYIYNNYIGDLLRNKPIHRINKIKPIYDINTIDLLFNIYVELVYKYKFNNRPLIVEFSIFTGINRDYFYDWRNGLNNNYLINSVSDRSSYSISDIVQNWISVCEQALLDGTDTIKDIFILKAKHGYRDNNNDVTITVNHKAIITADDMPDLIGINGKN